ncbi:MAG: hypothetical protein ACT4OZ_03960 [Gemmatimonadota bacterium]
MTPRGYLCTYCGSESQTSLRPGSVWIAAPLAIPFIVPGLLYLAWHFTTRRRLCPICHHATLIPGDSPLARTWRSAGWLGSGGAGGEMTNSDVRLERIEQAIDAIAMEVDRVSHGQRGGVGGSATGQVRLGEPGASRY